MKNKTIVILLSFLLITLSSYFLYKYQAVKRDNLSLELRLKMALQKKKKAQAWTELTEKAPSKSNVENTREKAIEAKVNIKIKKETIPTKLVDVRELETEELANKLQVSLKRHWKLDLKELERNIEIVDELLSRNPNVYSSYKAKLVLTLSKENLQGEYDDSTVEEILFNMSEFDVLSDKVLRKEAFLIAKTNMQADELFYEIEDLEAEILRQSDEELAQKLEYELNQKLDELNLIENQLEEGVLDEEDFLNEDLVEIPFLRSLAKEDYELVIENAESFLDEFPNSTSGHFFLLRALVLSDRNEEANDYIENLDLDESKMEDLKTRLNSSRNDDPATYYKNLRF